ncbi:MAG TPA: hypothetical protein VFO60_10075 [Candidatus Dormibacteraeota bacterium]|nr:hypothetical protein [Candidatus Dormibacteraeota bacterium]
MTGVRASEPGPRRGRLATVLALVGVAIAVAGCTSEITDTSAPYFANAAPVTGAPTVGPVGIIAGGTAGPSASGPVSRPNPRLTPGVVATSDVTSVCRTARRVHVPIPVAEQTAVFTAYGITVRQMKKYSLDYLVPPELGGATTERNVWPAAHTGVGFHEKEKLNALLRMLVCQGTLTLADVQQQLESDWYVLWLKNGAG